jgi:hypothetical protein
MVARTHLSAVIYNFWSFFMRPWFIYLLFILIYTFFSWDFDILFSFFPSPVCVLAES